MTFRPLLHEHARLSDEELDSYNKYNDMIDDLEYEIQQLEGVEIDVFDMKLELKMALDKVKSGSFNMVDIYLQGLKPRIKEQWEKLGRTPIKRVVKLVDEAELAEEFAIAKAAREAKGEKVDAGPAKKKLDLPELKLPGGVTVNSVMATLQLNKRIDLASEFRAYLC